MRPIDADALIEFIKTRIEPIPSGLSKRFPEIAVDDLKARCDEDMEIWCKIVDMQPTIEIGER